MLFVGCTRRSFVPVTSTSLSSVLPTNSLIIPTSLPDDTKGEGMVVYLCCQQLFNSTKYGSAFRCQFSVFPASADMAPLIAFKYWFWRNLIKTAHITVITRAELISKYTIKEQKLYLRELGCRCERAIWKIAPARPQSVFCEFFN